MDANGVCLQPRYSIQKLDKVMFHHFTWLPKNTSDSCYSAEKPFVCNRLYGLVKQGCVNYYIGEPLKGPFS